MKSLLSFLTWSVIILTLAQGLVPTMPFANPQTVTIVSAVFLFLVTALTAGKQFASNCISNNSLWYSLIILCLAVVGAFNDFYKVIPLSPSISQWLRFGITFITMLLNTASENLFPKAATTTAGALILFALLSIQSCQTARTVTAIVKKDCKVTNVVVTGTTQQICLRCDSLRNDAVQLLDSVLKLKFQEIDSLSK